MRVLLARTKHQEEGRQGAPAIVARLQEPGQQALPHARLALRPARFQRCTAAPGTGCAAAEALAWAAGRMERVLLGQQSRLAP